MGTSAAVILFSKEFITEIAELITVSILVVGKGSKAVLIAVTTSTGVGCEALLNAGGSLCLYLSKCMTV